MSSVIISATVRSATDFSKGSFQNNLNANVTATCANLACNLLLLPVYACNTALLLSAAHETQGGVKIIKFVPMRFTL